MGVVQDPQGAWFLVWEPRDHIGAGLVNAPGALSWNELGSPDTEASAKFYGDLLGWKTTAMEGVGMPYLVVSTAAGKNNGGIRAPTPPGRAGLLARVLRNRRHRRGGRQGHGARRQRARPPYDIGIAKIAVAQDRRARCSRSMPDSSRSRSARDTRRCDARRSPPCVLARWASAAASRRPARPDRRRRRPGKCSTRTRR